VRELVAYGLCAAVQVAALCGCGGSGTSDSRPKRGTETREGRLPPHEWSCGLAFGQVADDDVTARVSPTSIYLEMRTGACDTDGALLGSSATGLFPGT
jgi:hypothetical protein